MPNPKRFTHLRIKVHSDDPAALFSFLREATPFYESLPGSCIRLLRSIEDPTRFIELVEYETPDAYHADQLRVSSDPTMRSYLSTWRSLLKGGVEVETYEDVTYEIKGAEDGKP